MEFETENDNLEEKKTQPSGERTFGFGGKSYSKVMQEHERHLENYASSRQLRFLSQASVLEEAALPYHFRKVMFIILMTLSLALGWSIFAKVKEIAKTSGEIIPSSRVQVIQHLEGGTVARILVNDGDFVQRGQVLMNLAGDSVRAELQKAVTKDMTLKLQGQRYRAFANLGGQQPHKVSGDLSALAADQKKILAAMVENRQKQQNVVQEQINQRQEALKIAQSKLSTIGRNIKIAKDAFTLKKSLFEKGYASKTAFLDAERELNNLLGEKQKTESEIVQSNQAIEEFNSRLKSLDTNLRDDAMQKLSTIESEIAENKKNIEKLQQQIMRLQIHAPMPGIVKGLEVTTVGAVISPGQKIMEIVPMDRSLIAEVKINPSDVGNLKLNLDCMVKVSAFDFSRYGGIEGRLIAISATTFTSKEGASYYKGRIQMSKNFVGQNPAKNIVLPGMQVNVDIITGEKTVIGYLFKPIQVALSAAFTEK